MLITDQFVMLNFPKTGSSFARKSLMAIHAQRISRTGSEAGLRTGTPASLIELLLPKVDEQINYGVRDQHGVFRQIPQIHRHKQILSITRNPFARYVSIYLHRWWAEHPPADPDSIRKEFSGFPDLDFPDYYRMIHKYGRLNRLRGVTPGADLGLHTIQFVQFYFRDPRTALALLDEKYISCEAFRKEMAEIHFLRQENLRDDLRSYLSQLGYEPGELRLIDAMQDVNVTRRAEDQQDFRSFYTPELVDTILSRDRLLFRLFPEYLPVDFS